METTGGKSTLELNEKFINELPKTDEKIIDRYTKYISNQISKDAKLMGIQKARQKANIKFGKFWRERLKSKIIYTGNPFGQMFYY